MEKGEQHAQGVKTTLETMIGTDLSLKRKKKSEHDLNKELFEKIIIALERANIRTALVGTEFEIDLSKYADLDEEDIKPSSNQYQEKPKYSGFVGTNPMKNNSNDEDDIQELDLDEIKKEINNSINTTLGKYFK